MELDAMYKPRKQVRSAKNIRQRVYSQQQPRKVQCYNCNLFGHIARNCFKKKKDAQHYKQLNATKKRKDRQLAATGKTDHVQMLWTVYYDDTYLTHESDKQGLE